MAGTVNVLIGIQARSGSKRLPGKSFELIDDKIMTEHVINAAKTAATFVNKAKERTGILTNVVLLVPVNDPLVDAMAGHDIIEGPEEDVLRRFELAQELYHPDYMVRITADCPLIIPTIISKHIFTAVINKLDYCSNAYEDMRTFVDGYDCEIISKKLLKWVFANVSAKEDKEHVTTLIRKRPPPWAKFGVVVGHVDLSHIKLSVDTKEDLEAVRANDLAIKTKLEAAKNKNYQIFRF